MNDLVALARKHSDQSELYSIEQTENLVTVEDSKLQDIKSTMHSGVTIRLIKNHKLGFAYTRNPQAAEPLVKNALDSLKGGVEARFNFPVANTVPQLSTYDERISEATNTVLVDECMRVCSLLQEKTKAQINIDAETMINVIRIMNSAGTDLSTASSFYAITAMILYPGTATGIHKSYVFKAFQKLDEQNLNALAEIYNHGQRELKTTSGRMKVLFMPESMYTLSWRVQSATSGESLFHKQSPLAGKLDEKIFSEKLTIVDNPLDDTKPDARPFDDEGVPCRKFVLVGNGVLRNYYYDLNYAAKLDAEPTGHGFKTSRWGGETISMKPSPALKYLNFEPGEHDFRRLIKSMDRGIIVCGALGAHSGNIPNGDFSIGLAPGLYVENGEIAGRIKDAMITGNIYEVMKRVIAVENRAHVAYTGYYPAVLFDDVTVATKN
jgi:PmbA protein